MARGHDRWAAEHRFLLAFRLQPGLRLRFGFRLQPGLRLRFGFRLRFGLRLRFGFRLLSRHAARHAPGQTGADAAVGSGAVAGGNGDVRTLSGMAGLGGSLVFAARKAPGWPRAIPGYSRSTAP
jgi:hypothetical protein